jgi:uncharacterized protein (TIRG00374 family)
MLRSRLINLLAGICISVIFLYFAVKNVRYDEFMKYVHQLNFLYIIPALLPGLIAYLVRAWRWNYFLSSVGRFKVKGLLSATMIGFMANNILPARVGEIIRALVLSKKESISFISVLSSLIAERVMDGFTISIVALFVIYTLPVNENIKYFGLSFFAFFLIILILMFIFINSISVKKKLFGIFPERISIKINKYLNKIMSGIEGLNQVKNSGITFISAFMIWFLSSIYFYFMGLAMNIKLPFSASFSIFISVALGVIIPSSPGFIGVYHFFCQKAIEMYGVDTSKAFAYAVVTHFVQFIAVTALGFLFLFYENISLLTLSKEKKVNELK